MNASERKEKLKKEILSGSNPDKQILVDRLIELVGFDAMEFIQSLFMVDPFHRNPENMNLNSVAAYGVKKLLQLRAMESVDEFKFCPHCKSPLNKYKIIDPYSVGLKCPNNHKFHVQIWENEFHEKNLKVTKDNGVEIAKEWLNNENYRKNIQSQVAEILRKYVELNKANDKYADQPILNNYCPVCDLSLKKIKQDDVWVEGLKCANGHVFNSRNGLNYENSTLKPDINYITFKFLIDNYINTEKKEFLPEQIATLFRTIKETIE